MKLFFNTPFPLVVPIFMVLSLLVGIHDMVAVLAWTICGTVGFLNDRKARTFDFTSLPFDAPRKVGVWDTCRFAWTMDIEGYWKMVSAA